MCVYISCSSTHSFIHSLSNSILSDSPPLSSSSLVEKDRNKKSTMKNSIRCCISCILPCGALDVIRIVHSNGVVEEIRTSIKASEVLNANPKHLLKKPSSPSIIVQPDELLKRGKIYFLIPLPPSPLTMMQKKTSKRDVKRNSKAMIITKKVEVSDQYLSEIMSTKLSSKRNFMKGGRVGMWRPHLQIILE